MNAEAPSTEAARLGVARLSVTRLTLSNFRNYTQARLETGAVPVVLTGANGAGKTNVLEAVSFLTPGSGLRRARLSDVNHRGGSERNELPWAVAAVIEGGVADVQVGTGLEGVQSSKRQVHVDGRAERAQASLSVHFAAHWLTPQMDRLFLDGSQERRRFLDRLVFAFDPAHAGRMTAYTHAMRERAKLLGEGKFDDAWLSALEHTMATRGVSIAAARLDVAGRLAAVCERVDGPFPASRLAIDGLAEQALAAQPALEVEDRLRAALKGSRDRDAQVGCVGGGIQGRLPHQSDLLVTHAAKDMDAEQCSTGEQKMLLVGLVLAAARLSAQDESRMPVLLLDEVAAHLDERHREALFAQVLDLGCQAWFTGTDAALFASLKGQANFFDVDAGSVRQVD
jgi:DNA replication and repair protein RecF